MLARQTAADRDMAVTPFRKPGLNLLQEGILEKLLCHKGYDINKPEAELCAKYGSEFHPFSYAHSLPVPKASVPGRRRTVPASGLLSVA